MTPQWHPALAPFATRWQTFLDKVRARVVEIEVEARSGYAEVIAADAIDGTGLSGVSSALRARLLQLSAKVDDQWSKIDSELDSVDVEGRTGGYFRGAMLAITSQWKRWFEREMERMIMRGEADGARALQAAAIEETQLAVACQHCGAALHRPMWHQSINVTCPHCKAVSVVTPGTATAMFIGGSGSIFLAREAAWDAWCAMQDAEHVWQRLRHKTADDLARWEAANRAYWQAYASAMGTVHPGWTADYIAAEVRSKMNWFTENVMRDDQVERATNSAGIAALSSGDPNQVAGWLRQQRDPSDAAEMLIQAAIERGWAQHATWAAQIAGPIVAADEPGWAAEKVDEVSYYHATRGT